MEGRLILRNRRGNESRGVSSVLMKEDILFIVVVLLRAELKLFWRFGLETLENLTYCILLVM